MRSPTRGSYERWPSNLKGQAGNKRKILRTLGDVVFRDFLLAVTFHSAVSYIGVSGDFLFNKEI